MLTGESLEREHAEVGLLISYIRTSIANSQATVESSDFTAVDVAFERGRQAGLLYTLAKLERLHEEALQ